MSVTNVITLYRMYIKLRMSPLLKNENDDHNGESPWLLALCNSELTCNLGGYKSLYAFPLFMPLVLGFPHFYYKSVKVATT